MLRTIVSTSLRQPFLILALGVALLVLGYRNLRNAPLDVFPEFAPPLVEIQTEAPGLSTEEVESLVTVPLENALNGTPSLKTIRSKSVLGLSSIVMIFQENVDLMRARQLVQERLAIETSRLPAVAKPPVILSPLSSTSRVLKIGIWSEKLSQMEMTELAKWTIRPRLMAVPGVANVAIWGERDRQYQVLVDPERLRANGLTLADVERAAGDAAVVSGGGFVDTPNQRLPVRHVSTIVSADDLKNTVVAYRAGAPLCLGDVADVREGHPPPIGDAIINDVAGLLLIVEKQPTGNTLDVTRNVEAALDQMRPGLKDVHIDSTIFRPATFIEMSLHNLGWSLVIGCALVLVILIAFLYDWRTALISSTAIPLSLVAAALVLRQAGVTMNTMVLAGLIIALGEVVDDAIIDVENIIRRLRLNRAAGNPRSAFRVILSASVEVRSAVVYGSFTVMLVIMPVFFLEGLAGSFFRPLAIAYVLAIFASLIVAMTVTPAMSLLLLPGRSDARHESPLITALKRPYRSALPALIAHPKTAGMVFFGILVATAATVPYLGEEFMPKFQEYDFLMHWVEKPGTSIEAMDRVTVRVSKELRSVEGVRNFGSHIGRAEVADEVVGPNFTELWISLDRDVDYSAKVAEIQEVVDGYPGLYRDLLTYLRERIKEVLTGASASIVIRIYGDDIDTLREHAQRVEAAIQDVPGVSDLKIELQSQVPQIDVRPIPEATEQFGLTSADVRRAATTLIKGRIVGEVYRQQKVYQVAVWGAPDVRTDLDAIRNCLIDTPNGARVPLKAVAEIADVAGYVDAARRALSLDHVRGRDNRDLGPEHDQARERVAPHRRNLQRPRSGLGQRSARNRRLRPQTRFRSRIPSRIPRRVRGAATVAPRHPARGDGRFGGNHYPALFRVPRLAPRFVDHVELSLRGNRRCVGCMAGGRKSIAGFARGVHHRDWHCRAQRDHDDQPFPASRGRGVDGVRRCLGDSRRGRAPRPHLDDRADGGPGPLAACRGGKPARPRDRVSHGMRHSRRPFVIDADEPVDSAVALSRFRLPPATLGFQDLVTDC